MEEQAASGSDVPQFYEVVVMDSSKQDEEDLDNTSDGITVTLKDSTTDEDVPMSVSTSEGILVPQNVVSQGEIQIAELQTTGDQEVSVVYTSASDVPQIQYVTQTATSSEQIEEGIQHNIVVQGEEGKQIVVQTLPQEIQATILNTIEEMKTAKMEENAQEVPDISSKDAIPETVVCSEPNMGSVSSITCSRNDQPLDDMVPPQILATEDENTGPDDIPMETNGEQLIHQTVSSVDVISEGTALSQENNDLPSSEEEKVMDSSSLVVESDSENKAEDSGKDNKEVTMAKFAPLTLTSSESDKQSALSSDVPMDKPRIVSISHGTAGSEGNGQMEVPNFMDGTDGDDINSQEGLSLVQGGAAILTSVDDVGITKAYVIRPSKAGTSKGKAEKGVVEKETPESLLVNVESMEPKKDGKKLDNNAAGKSTPDGKQKGEKGKNEILHGMQLLSECAMRLENQDGGPEEEVTSEETIKENDANAEPKEDPESQLKEHKEMREEKSAEESGEVDVEVTKKEEVEKEEGVSTVLQKPEDGEGEIHLNIQSVASEGTELIAEPILENAGPVQTTTEVVVTSQGQVLKAVPGSNYVTVPLEIGNSQEVVIDSQQISEELIPMVQEEVILEIVEGDQIAVSNSGVLVNDLYGGQAIGGDKNYIVQGLAPSVMQQGNLPSSHRVRTYSQELKKEKKRSRKRGPKHKVKHHDPSPQRKRVKTEATSSSDGSKQKYQCHVCQKLFEKMKELRDHLLVHYNTKGYVCDFCNKTFSSSSHLRRHVMIHTGERPHKCDYCGEGFIQAVQLRVHKHRHSHGPPPPLSRAPPRSKKKEKKDSKPTRTDRGQKYQCPVCKVKHKSKKKIKAHMKVHSTHTKTFKCKDCNEVFRNKNQLTIHEGRHKGKPELQCSYCGKAFDTSSHMKRHERIHTGEKPYKCQFCDKSFIQGVQLRLHERIHTGERPHVCTYCGKAFARTQYLKRHSCIHTGEKPLQCRFCLERFIQPVQRQQHEKKFHKKKLKKLLAQKQKPGQPPIKLVLRLKKKKGRKGEEEVTDSDDSDSESESSGSNESN